MKKSLPKPVVNRASDGPPPISLKPKKPKSNHKSNKREPPSGSARVSQRMIACLQHHIHLSSQLVSCLAKTFPASVSVETMANKAEAWSAWKRGGRHAFRGSSRPSHSARLIQASRESSRNQPPIAEEQDNSINETTGSDQFWSAKHRLPFEAAPHIDLVDNARGWRRMATKAAMAVAFVSGDPPIVNRPKDNPAAATPNGILTQIGNEYDYMKYIVFPEENEFRRRHPC